MTATIKTRIGQGIANYLNRPVANYQQFSVYEAPVLEKHLQPGDVLLVEGDSRVSGVIKYLTQSTWSHAAFYAGNFSADDAKNDDPLVLIEAELGQGVIASPLSKYHRFNTRICRPVGLSDDERKRVVATMVASLGKQYDLKHIIDLARYLFPTPPVPIRWRRRMIAFGSGDPSRAICSTLIAETFQSIKYPILPRVEKRTQVEQYSYSVEEIHHIRHHSLFTPRDFDVSPFFKIVKPTIESNFDFHTLKFSDDEAKQYTHR